MEATTLSSTIDSWTICRSFVHKEYPQANLLSPEHHYIPPSQWGQTDVEKYCFLHRNISNEPARYSSISPGTALFQHWLSDFENSTTWNPWNDFPTRDIMNQYPDISDDGDVFVDEETDVSARDYYTLWYTTSITASQHAQKFDFLSNHAGVTSDKIRWKRGHFTLEGVNYQPMVYYDGELLHPYSIFDDSTDEEVNVGGMFLRRHYDLGVWGNEDDVPLEILVLPPPVVGKPTTDSRHTMSSNADPINLQPLRGETSSSRNLDSSQRDKANEPHGQGGDHDLAQSGAIMQFTAGWDWIQPTPDRNTGIWDKVQVDWIWGDVRLHDVRVKVLNIAANEGDETYNQNGVEEGALPLGGNVLVSARLNLSVTATYHGHEADEPIIGAFQYEIADHGDSSSILASGRVENITIHQSVSEYSLGEVRLSTAKLWWPHTHGSQPLYTVALTFQSNDTIGAASIHESQVHASFGIRTISSYTHPLTKSLTVRVNGHSIFLVGGNWITTDQFLRFSTSQQRYIQELLHMKNIGFNSIRVWGGGLTETRHFYNAADRLGLLIYQEFWMTGELFYG
jgi:hypothetical protein